MDGDNGCAHMPFRCAAGKQDVLGKSPSGFTLTLCGQETRRGFRRDGECLVEGGGEREGGEAGASDGVWVWGVRKWKVSGSKRLDTEPFTQKMQKPALGGHTTAASSRQQGRGQAQETLWQTGGSVSSLALICLAVPASR